MFFIPNAPQNANMARIKQRKGKKMSEEKESLVNGRSSSKYYGMEENKIDELVYFNVSGRSFATTIQTLEFFPNSLLGCKQERDQLPRTKCGEIFLNRHAAVFESILTFYQSGVFEAPTNVNQNIFVSDVIYYGLQQEAVESGLKGFDIDEVPFPENKIQCYLWILLEYPDSSLLARVVSMFSLTTIIISIIIFCWETLPAYKKPVSQLSASKQLTVKALNDIEIFCIAYFSIEFIVRLVCSPSKGAFIKDVLNLIDFVSILPFYITLIFNMEGNVSIYFLRAVRLVRVFRVFKLSRHSSEMKILGIAVKDSARELGVLLFFILLGVLLFSSAVYYAEGGMSKSPLQSIPGAFWWSIVTMTTVGYGDEVPHSTAGRLIGAVCAMTGILVIAMPIPIIVNNFTRQYQRLKPVSRFWLEFQEREKQQPARKQVLGLFNLCDLNENDLLISSNPCCGTLLMRRSHDDEQKETDDSTEKLNLEEKVIVIHEIPQINSSRDIETHM
ncbi:shaker-related potassium channel tsha2-like isoform X1 [Hydractinia symbiolongicarpus]|uniref:shaker-related potassium channel tsha2-like isoform X1 n=2 Tax=Hydractinia symbiolongicarpus TaxID=13093 RepID=UPI00254E6F0C|nr:shaker-related potassium channel tsha2-like isoform X1 [Hydractinia symbiolongicarpus]